MAPASCARAFSTASLRSARCSPVSSRTCAASPSPRPHQVTGAGRTDLRCTPKSARRERDRNRSLRSSDPAATVNLRMDRSNPANHPNFATVPVPAAPMGESSRRPHATRAVIRLGPTGTGSPRLADLSSSCARTPVGARHRKIQNLTRGPRGGNQPVTDLAEGPVPSGSYDERSARHW